MPVYVHLHTRSAVAISSDKVAARDFLLLATCTCDRTLLTKRLQFAGREHLYCNEVALYCSYEVVLV